MTKLIDPLLSLNARGKIGKLISLTRRQKQNIAETLPFPYDPKTLAQLSWRHMFLKVVALWHLLSASEKQEWESSARRHHMTGYNYFISLALRPNPGIYLPLQGGVMAGDIDMAKFRILKLPLPTDPQEAASKVYVDTAIPPGGYTEGARVYHSVSLSIPNNTATRLSFNSERYDTDTIHDTVVFNSRLTCKTAGKYLISLAALFAANAIGRRSFSIIINNVAGIAGSYGGLDSLNYRGISMATLYHLAVNDYVEAEVYQTSGGALSILASPQYSLEFMMQRIG